MAAFKRLIKLGKGAKKPKRPFKKFESAFVREWYLLEIGNVPDFIRFTIHPFCDRF